MIQLDIRGNINRNDFEELTAVQKQELLELVDHAETLDELALFTLARKEQDTFYAAPDDTPDFDYLARRGGVLHAVVINHLLKQDQWADEDFDDLSEIAEMMITFHPIDESRDTE